MICEVVFHCVLATNNILNTSIAMFLEKRKMVFCIREVLLDLFKAHVSPINQTQQKCVVGNDCGDGGGLFHFNSPFRLKDGACAPLG
jgi:hypothetical protein